MTGKRKAMFEPGTNVRHVLSTTRMLVLEEINEDDADEDEIYYLVRDYDCGKYTLHRFQEMELLSWNEPPHPPL